MLLLEGRVVPKRRIWCTARVQTEWHLVLNTVDLHNTRVLVERTGVVGIYELASLLTSKNESPPQKSVFGSLSTFSELDEGLNRQA